MTSPVPAFAPVRLRARRDGWTPARQRAFLRFLALGCSVAAAAARVGLSREGAYRLRRRAGAASFAAAWDAIRAGAPAPDDAYAAPRPLLAPVTTIRFRNGRPIGSVTRPDIAGALARLGALDRWEARLSEEARARLHGLTFVTFPDDPAPE